MSERLRELREWAIAATPGPWVAQSSDDGKSGPWWIDTHAYPDGPEPVWAPPQYPVSMVDAAYIAAVSPDVVLRLLRIEEAAETYVAHVQSLACDHSESKAGTHTGCPEALTLRDALQEDSHVGK
jgi:hypothetical protein